MCDVLKLLSFSDAKCDWKEYEANCTCPDKFERKKDSKECGTYGIAVSFTKNLFSFYILVKSESSFICDKKREQLIFYFGKKKPGRRFFTFITPW